LTRGIDADQDSKPLQIQDSDYSPTTSSGYVDGGGNISAAPVFADSASGNYREDASSPTIDAGAPDPELSTTDLDGNGRALGSAPDMGAYEFVPGGAPSQPGPPTTSPPAPPAVVPVYGVSVTLAPISGVVTVEVPHAKTFQTLTAGMTVPVGSVIDARHGAVALTSAINRQGASRTGDFHGGRFFVGQSRKGSARTKLRLLGGSFAACRRSHRFRHDVLARAAGGRPKPHHRVVRQLWGSDNGGKFTTVGRGASAAVRGTVWLTQDRCDGTLIKVLKGHVVVRDHHHHVITLGPGQSYLAHVRP